MSYDLMVFDPLVAPKERKEFMEWYKNQTEWTEDHNYQDHAVTTDKLKAWYQEMMTYFPPMNGPLASDDDIDNPNVTDYSIGQHVIYSGFAWSVAEKAYPMMRNLAIKHSVGFFDVSADNGEILFPPHNTSPKEKKPFWKFW